MDFKVSYNYFGKGYVLIDAESSEEAEQKYLDGEYLPESEFETHSSYDLEDVELAEPVPF